MWPWAGLFAPSGAPSSSIPSFCLSVPSCPALAHPRTVGAGWTPHAGSRPRSWAPAGAAVGPWGVFTLDFPACQTGVFSDRENEAGSQMHTDSCGRHAAPPDPAHDAHRCKQKRRRGSRGRAGTAGLSRLFAPSWGVRTTAAWLQPLLPCRSASAHARVCAPRVTAPRLCRASAS